MTFAANMSAALALLVLSACPPMTTTTDPATADPWAGTHAQAGAPAAPAPVSPAPTGIVGVWLDRWSASMQYKLATRIYDFDTGVWFGGLAEPWDMAPYRGFGIALEPDGSFVWIREQDGGIGGCKSYTIHLLRGKATLAGDVIRFHPTAQRQKHHSTCDPQLDIDRELPNQDFEMRYTLGATVDTGAPTLRLVDSAGTAFDYFRG